MTSWEELSTFEMCDLWDVLNTKVCMLYHFQLVSSIIKYISFIKVFFYQLLQIFIPMNDQGVHWYLVVVDFSERKMYLIQHHVMKESCLDKRCLEIGIYISLFFNFPFPFLTYTKVNITIQSLFLEKMFIEDSFYDCWIKLQKHIISRGIISPRYES